jgi:mRNA interferase MazF
MNEDIRRGDIWVVRFDPSEGDEIRKSRPAVLMTAAGAGKMRLHIVVPITGWQSLFQQYFWMIQIIPNIENGLTKESAADAFQVKSVSIRRFQQRLGHVTPEQLQEISAAIALCVGYSS